MNTPDAQDQPSEETKTNRLFKWLVIGIISLVVFYAITLIALTWPITHFTVEAAGTFGDSFGLLTSLFSGLAFAGLIWTILLQRVELRLQRKELQESRRQAILTRVMNIIQNQIGAYRTEISTLRFQGLETLSNDIGIHQMLYTMNGHLENMAQERANNGLSPEEHIEMITDYLRNVFSSIRSYQVLIEGLHRCCKANRYLLINEAITSNEAQDAKALFFAELPTGLMYFVFQLDTILKVFLKIKRKQTGSTADLFDPARKLYSDCELILSHESHAFSEENMASDRKQKWLFAP
ncbi:hypothetical protein INP77_03585 [Methylophilus sp. 13]|uniref:hypothetical protein n=1 Tax=Methylophilus sp. 13 TaxID=2781018 RepID=UPI00188FDA33|nr:hypothetical protein [Methylophilus sp. 13]MBF5038571.1 hypothetical protein [Methylophilus sp. 13]